MSLFPLSTLKKGREAQIVEINETKLMGSNLLPKGELERRLLEMGFSEGTTVTLIEEGPFGKDPLVFLLRSCHLIALRRQEASAILVQNLV